MPAPPSYRYGVAPATHFRMRRRLLSRRRVTRAALACIAWAIATGAAGQGTIAPVYRCTEPGGTVLYADYPCKGGAQVDIRAGTAAPDATEQLARARDELDRSAARRAAADEAAALRREARNARQQEFDVASYAGATILAPDVSYLPAYGYYIPRAKAHRHKARPPAALARVAPLHRVPVVRPR